MLSGGDGDDIFHVRPVDLVATEIYDGGEGIDTFHVADFSADISDLTLTSVERVVIDIV